MHRQFMAGVIWGVFRDFWKEILTPSPVDEKPYKFTVVAISHAMLGAVFSFAGLLFGAAYWFLKERGDLKRKGNIWDGLIDTGFVLIGTRYTGPEWWPIAIVFLAGVGGVLKEALRRLKGNGASKA